jgi:hypothetical protein
VGSAAHACLQLPALRVARGSALRPFAGERVGRDPPGGRAKRRTSEVETVQNPAFWRWAIQDSNLGPLPYKQAMKAADKLMLASKSSAMTSCAHSLCR